MKAIAVIDKDLALGYKGDLLFRLPSDLAHFKANTLGKTIVMGQTTLLSMPHGRPLPGRSTLVLAQDWEPQLLREDGPYKSYSFRTLEAFRDYVDAHGLADELIVCGGASIYRLFLPECDELILTEVDQKAPEADVWFPDFREDFELAEEDGPYEDGEYTYNIRTYRRKKAGRAKNPICEACGICR